MPNYSNLHPIFCPYCMRTYPANNVVFRKSQQRDTSDYVDDAYLMDYDNRFLRRNRLTYRLPRTIDPAYLSENDKQYDKEGMIIGVRDAEGDGSIATERVCPYCHNKINACSGVTKNHTLTVVGFQGSGKTTYEATLLNVIMLDKFGLLNLSECENPQSLDESAANLVSGKDVNSTQEEEGPFHYQVTFNENAGATNFLLTMVDLPGERFVNRDELSRSGKAVSNSDTCIFLVDIEHMEQARYVFGTLVNTYRVEISSGNINVAVVLYKADKLIYKFPSVPSFLEFNRKRTYANCQPINMSQIDQNHQSILNNVVYSDSQLAPLHTALAANIPPDNLRWFAAFSKDKGRFAPNNVEEPLLWSLARKGMYPHV